MKICHLTSVHTRYDTRIFLKECCFLAKCNHKLFLVVADGKCDEVKDNVSIFDVGVAESRISRMLRATRSIFNTAKNLDADVYHIHDPELLPVALSLKIRGKKVIYDVHEDLPRQILSKAWIAKPLRRIFAYLAEIVENFSAKKLDAIVAATPHIRDRFLAIGCNAIDVCNYPILDELVCIEKPWEKREKAICYVGGIWEQRGIFEIIQAIDFVDAKLLLAGKFAYETERIKASSISGWEKLEELGQLDRHGVAETLARSVAGLVTLHPIINYLDALPIKMFEYMSSGIPVIASNFSLWREVIEDNQCGICVDPLDPSAIADAMKYLLENPNIAESMGNNGRHSVREKYNWENEYKKLIHLYENIS
jgi:glycosyltransferase involved in cell wall biosynthesis